MGVETEREGIELREGRFYVSRVGEVYGPVRYSAHYDEYYTNGCRWKPNGVRASKIKGKKRTLSPRNDLVQECLCTHLDGTPVEGEIKR